MTIPGIRDIVVTKISDEILQYIPKYHVSVMQEDAMDFEILHSIIRDSVRNNFGVNWMPGFVEFYTEPLKRMSNLKLDVNYYQTKDNEEYEAGVYAKETINAIRLERKV